MGLIPPQDVKKEQRKKKNCFQQASNSFAGKRESLIVGNLSSSSTRA
jgi:hypothetical protein